ncbi:hypothetical protein IOD06_00335 [Psychrobacter sp. N25K4-3-2]|uniref:hypothetical protein n=1 Tax=Psychrobacter sp. N25K4-3-2 TaxID=2785026 RepID=UPI00188BFB42|nr:hypothetical protein [Psychrobacter sp. N25K4-3-2]MBF4488335.1 hypothetical protein [Psychrobacter sp. N25K4-3-2]
MNDEKKDIGTDFDEELTKLVNKKSRKLVKNNIYERFISRVDGTEDNNQDEGKSDQLTPWENIRQSPNYESLSSEELQFFATSEDNEGIDIDVSDTTTTDVSFDFINEEEIFGNDEPLADTPQSSNKDYPDSYDLDENSDLELDSHHVEHTSDDTDTDVFHPAHNDDQVVGSKVAENTVVENTAEPVNNAAIKPQSKLASNKKPLIIGIAIGTLLAAIIVLTINASGILSPSTEGTVSDASKEVASNIETNASSDTQPKIQAKAAKATTLSNNPPVTDAEPSAATNPNQTDALSSVAADKETEQTLEATTDGLDNEAAISYEDFRQESQSTLYRETND